MQAIGQQSQRAPDGARSTTSHRPNQTTQYRLVQQDAAGLFDEPRQLVAGAGFSAFINLTGVLLATGKCLPRTNDGAGCGVRYKQAAFDSVRHIVHRRCRVRQTICRRCFDVRSIRWTRHVQ